MSVFIIKDFGEDLSAPEIDWVSPDFYDQYLEETENDLGIMSTSLEEGANGFYPSSSTRDEETNTIARSSFFVSLPREGHYSALDRFSVTTTLNIGSSDVEFIITTGNQLKADYVPNRGIGHPQDIIQVSVKEDEVNIVSGEGDAISAMFDATPVHTEAYASPLSGEVTVKISHDSGSVTVSINEVDIYSANRDAGLSFVELTTSHEFGVDGEALDSVSQQANYFSSVHFDYDVGTVLETPPVIEFIGERGYVIAGEPYVDEGYTVTDADGNPVDPTWIVEDEFSSDTGGFKFFYVNAVDRSWNLASGERLVFVDPQDPTFGIEHRQGDQLVEVLSPTNLAVVPQIPSKVDSLVRINRPRTKLLTLPESDRIIGEVE